MKFNPGAGASDSEVTVRSARPTGAEGRLSLPVGLRDSYGAAGPRTCGQFAFLRIADDPLGARKHNLRAQPIFMEGRFTGGIRLTSKLSRWRLILPNLPLVALPRVRGEHNVDWQYSQWQAMLSRCGLSVSISKGPEERDQGSFFISGQREPK